MRRHQRLIAFAVAALACVAFALCGCTNSEVYYPPLKQAQVAAPVIGEDGTLRVGVNTENPPLAGMGSGKVIGVDVDIAAALADELGLRLVVIDVGSDAATYLENNQVDIVMGIDDSNTDTDFWLSPSYLPTGIALFALDPETPVPSAENNPTFAAQVSSKSAWAVSNEFGETSLTPTDSLSNAFSALSSGSVQYVAADAIIGMYAAHGQGLNVSIVAMLMAPSGYCMGASVQNTELQAVAGDALARLVSNGTIGVIELKWLGATVDLADLPVVSTANPSAGIANSSDGENADDSEESGNGSEEGNDGEQSSGDNEDEASGSGSSDSNDANADSGSSRSSDGGTSSSSSSGAGSDTSSGSDSGSSSESDEGSGSNSSSNSDSNSDNDKDN